MQDFQIIHNYVYRVWADGIHVTGQGTHNGLISRNIVRENGDDMIAVVNYRSGEPTIYNIEVSDNDIAGNYWGRGITVIGGKDIRVLRNKIDRVYTGAGILLFGDGLSWNTANVKRVLVEGNTVTRTMTDDAHLQPDRGVEPQDLRCGSPSLREGRHRPLRERPTRLVTDNNIRNNRIDGVRGDGVHIRAVTSAGTVSLGERDGQPQWRPGQDSALVGDLSGRMIMRTRRSRIARIVRPTLIRSPARNRLFWRASGPPASPRG